MYAHPVGDHNAQSIQDCSIGVASLQSMTTEPISTEEKG